jgi:hypothetical protein
MRGKDRGEGRSWSKKEGNRLLFILPRTLYEPAPIPGPHVACKSREGGAIRRDQIDCYALPLADIPSAMSYRRVSMFSQIARISRAGGPGQLSSKRHQQLLDEEKTVSVCPISGSSPTRWRVLLIGRIPEQGDESKQPVSLQVITASLLQTRKIRGSEVRRLAGSVASLHNCLATDSSHRPPHRESILSMPTVAVLEHRVRNAQTIVEQIARRGFRWDELSATVGKIARTIEQLQLVDQHRCVRKGVRGVNEEQLFCRGAGEDGAFTPIQSLPLLVSHPGVGWTIESSLANLP